MAIRWSPSTGGFYHSAINAGSIPADAVRITDKLHAELLAGRATGRTIVAGAQRKPELAPAAPIEAGRILTSVIAAIKREARSRILAIASLERQANDNAAIAMKVLGGSGAVGQALDRRDRIDAIRAASNALEAEIATWSPAALSTFDASAAAHWPAGA